MHRLIRLEADRLLVRALEARRLFVDKSQKRGGGRRRRRGSLRGGDEAVDGENQDPDAIPQGDSNDIASKANPPTSSKGKGQKKVEDEPRPGGLFTLTVRLRGGIFGDGYVGCGRTHFVKSTHCWGQKRPCCHKVHSPSKILCVLRRYAAGREIGTVAHWGIEGVYHDLGVLVSWFWHV